jgi:hypothetical protein
MDPVAVALVALAAGAVLGRLLVRGRKDRREFWRRSAEQAGLTAIEVTSKELRASRGPFDLRLSTRSATLSDWISIEIRSPRLPAGLTLEPEGPAEATATLKPKEIYTGDSTFDREISVRGSKAMALALLDPELRGTLRSLIRNGMLKLSQRAVSDRLDTAALRIELSESSLSASPELAPGDGNAPLALHGRRSLPGVLRFGLELAERLSTPDDLGARLASRFAHEPQPSARREILQALVQEFPGTAAQAEALSVARGDADVEIRLQAGVALGAEGRELLLAMAGDSNVLDAVSSRAVASLAASLTGQEASALLDVALRRHRRQTARRCVEVLGQRGGAASIEALTRLLASGLASRQAWHGLADEAASALAETRDPRVEPALLAALRSPSKEVAEAAARALGRIGTVAAVMPLREAEERGSSVGSAARQAVSEIHARLSGAEAGQLAIAGDAGRLTIVEVEPGQLSIPDRKAESSG